MDYAIKKERAVFWSAAITREEIEDRYRTTRESMVVCPVGNPEMAVPLTDFLEDMDCFVGLPAPKNATNEAPSLAEPVLPLSTLNEIAGYPVTGTIGVVSHEVILGAGIFADLKSDIADIVGGRAGGYESRMAKARQEALLGVAEKGSAIGATAVVGIRLTFDTIDKMLMVTATGTAVLC